MQTAAHYSVFHGSKNHKTYTPVLPSPATESEHLRQWTEMAFEAPRVIQMAAKMEQW